MLWATADASTGDGHQDSTSSASAGQAVGPLREAAHLLRRVQIIAAAYAQRYRGTAPRAYSPKPVAVRPAIVAGQPVFQGVLGMVKTAQVRTIAWVAGRPYGAGTVVLHPWPTMRPEHRQVARQDIRSMVMLRNSWTMPRGCCGSAEQLAVDRIAAELRVDAVARMPDVARAACGPTCRSVPDAAASPGRARSSSVGCAQAILAHDVSRSRRLRKSSSIRRASLSRRGTDVPRCSVPG